MKATLSGFLLQCSVIASLAGTAPFATAAGELPLKPSRHIEFAVQEGTWLSLDISPDARTIVFELLGDIYSLDAGGGEAKLLLSGMPFESQPAFSPDGRRIAFLSDRSGSENLWIANADGSSPQQLTRDEDDRTFASPAWSPDGQYVYVARSIPSYGIFELWMYHVQGGSGVQITRANGAGAKGGGGEMHTASPVDVRPNAMGAAPSPDGRYLYYAQKLGGFEYNAELPMWSILRRDLRSNTEETLISAPGSAMRPAVSRDGKLLAYATRFEGKTGLRLRNLDTGEDRWLAYPVQRDEQEAMTSRDLLPGYDFTPDGQALLIAYGGKIRRIAVGSGTAAEVPFTARVKLDIGPDLRGQQATPTGPVRARVVQTPRQSPDGKTLVLSALGQVHVMPLRDGATPKRLTRSHDAEFHPSWSQDGRWITYVTWSANGGHIWKARADGGGSPQRLTTVAGYYSDPLFAADGKSVFALRSSNYARTRTLTDLSPGRVADLVRIPAAGGDVTLISHASGARSLHLTSDTQRLFFYSDGGLQSVRLDGSDRRTHVQVKGLGQRVQPDPVNALDAQLSPDGKWALARLGSHLHLIAIPQTGDTDFSVNLAQPSVPYKRVTQFGADYFAWADGGKTVTWSLGSTFFRLPFEQITFDQPQPAGESQAPISPPKNPPQQFIAQVDLPRDVPGGTVVLRGATAITMKGDEVIENADVVIENNRIAAIGARGTVSIPAAAAIRDVAGRFIVPGFVDTHAHWFEIRRGVLDLQNWSFLANLAYGVTTGLDVQPFTSDMFVYEDMIEAGLMPGPRAHSTGPGMFSDNRLKSLQEARDLLTRYRDFYGTRNLKSYAIGNRRERQFVVAAAAELGMIPTTEGALDFKLDLTHALDGFAGNEHALPTVPLYEDVVQLFARSGIGYTITALVAYGGPFAEDHFFMTQAPANDPKIRRFMPPDVIDARTRRAVWFRDSDQIYPQLAEGAARIMRAGGRVGVGSHGQFQGLGYHWELQALASGGLTPKELLQAATLQSADIIGRSNEIGSLEPGKFADLLILERNPLEDIRNTLSLRQVMKNGRLYDADTLNEVWPRERVLPAMWFSNDRP